MLKRFKFLPALALAAVLSPLAANAWTGQVSNPGQSQAPVAAEAGGQASTTYQGRGYENHVPPGGAVSDATPQYAAANHAATAGEGG